MKYVFCLWALALAPALFAAPVQAPTAEPAAQASTDNPRSPSGKATSHDRHMRKHRNGNHHHRPRTTAKNHNS
jgi:hypothetical protein